MKVHLSFLAYKLQVAVNIKACVHVQAPIHAARRMTDKVALALLNDAFTCWLAMKSMSMQLN